MLHRAHAATGALAGAGLVASFDLLGADIRPAAYPIYTLACAGWALAPDLDTDKSTFTRSGGPVTRALAEVLQWCARFTYRHSHRECDSPTTNGEHRGLLHTGLFSLAVGAAVGFVSTLHPWVGPIVLAIVASPAIRSLSWPARRIGAPRELGHRWGALAAAAALAALAFKTTDVALSGPLFGAVATVGMLTHIAGDGVTTHGVPWLGGIPHRCDKHRAHRQCRRCGRSRPKLTKQRRCNCGERYRKPQRRCAMWDTSHNVPQRWVAKAGHNRETIITRVCLVITAIATIAGASGALG